MRLTPALLCLLTMWSATASAAHTTKKAAHAAKSKTAASTPAKAGGPSEADVTAYLDAGKRFAGLVTGAELGTKSAQLKTPEVRALVRMLSDDKRMLPAEFTPEQLPMVSDICGAANKAMVSLSLFDLKNQMDPRGSPEQISLQSAQLIKANTLAFQDELGQLQPFLFRCLAREIPPLTTVVLGIKPNELTEQRRRGVAGMRVGFMQLASAAIGASSDDEFRKDYRLALVSALAETAPPLAAIIPPNARMDSAEVMDKAAATAKPPYQEHLRAIAKAFRSTDCQGLCVIP